MALFYPFFGYWLDVPAAAGHRAEPPLRGKHRGVTQSPNRAKRRNRRKP